MKKGKNDREIGGKHMTYHTGLIVYETQGTSTGNSPNLHPYVGGKKRSGWINTGHFKDSIHDGGLIG